MAQGAMTAITAFAVSDTVLNPVSKAILPADWQTGLTGAVGRSLIAGLIAVVIMAQIVLVTLFLHDLLHRRNRAPQCQVMVMPYAAGTKAGACPRRDVPGKNSNEKSDGMPAPPGTFSLTEIDGRVATVDTSTAGVVEASGQKTVNSEEVTPITPTGMGLDRRHFS